MGANRGRIPRDVRRETKASAGAVALLTWRDGLRSVAPESLDRFFLYLNGPMKSTAKCARAGEGGGSAGVYPEKN